MPGIHTHHLFPSIGKWSSKSLSSLAIGSLVLSSASAHAAQDTAHDTRPLFDGIGEVVSDAELGQMRGRFIRPGEVSFFGISMLTSWSDESGITTTANLMFNIDFLASNGHGEPGVQLVVSWNREGDPAMDVLDTHAGYTPFLVGSPAVPLGGLETGAGAAQANIIAGADNHARNGLQIALVPSSALNGRQLVDGPNAIEETTSVSFTDGDTLQFQIADNQIGLVMTGNNGIDSSLQTVGGDVGRVLQQTMLNSNNNDVLNSTSILFGTDAMPGTAEVTRISEALNSASVLGF